MRKLDLTNQRFGRLTVIAFSHVSKKNRMWLCRCDCGSVKHVPTDDLRSKKTVSCGCYSRERLGNASRTHGHSVGRLTAEYVAWRAMKQRCYTPSHPRYKSYGGRGIKVCEQWRNSFETFLADMGPKPGWAHSLGRKDNNADYSQSNCRWETRTQQDNNKTNNVIWEYEGVKKTMAQWAESIGISHSALSKRRDRGWTLERILSTPIRT